MALSPPSPGEDGSPFGESQSAISSPSTPPNPRAHILTPSAVPRPSAHRLGDTALLFDDARPPPPPPDGRRPRPPLPAPRRAAGRSESAESPTPYAALLPATLKLRAARETLAGPAVGVAAGEMLAARGAKRARPPPAAHRVPPPMELRAVEGRMRAWAERSRVQRRRWRHSPVGVAAASSAGSGGSRASSSSGTGRPWRGESRAAARARRAFVQLASASAAATGTAELQRELRESAAAVAAARHGHARGPSAPQLVASPARAALAEDVSWGAAGLRSASTSRSSAPSTPRSGDGREERGEHGLAVALRGLLQRARCGLESVLHSPRRGARPAPTRQRKRRESEQTETALAETTAMLPPLMADRGTPSEVVSLPARHERRSGGKVARSSRADWGKARRKPFPVECGVGEHTRVCFERRHMERCTEDLKKELQRGENVRRARQLMRDLMPERERLLDAALERAYESPRAVLEAHRRAIFASAAEADAAERRSACLAFIDVLEEWYQKTVPEAAWPPVRTALERSREIVLHSPTRRNGRAFFSILKDCFLMVHLAERSVREMLEHLSELFEMNRAEFKEAMAIAYQRLNRPQDYEARFRDLDRVVLGKLPPTETRLRAVLHRGRYIPLVHASLPGGLAPTMGGGSGTAPSPGGGGMSEDAMTEPEVTVRLRTDHSAITSAPVRARATSTTSAGGVAERPWRDAPPVGVANLQKQTFRLQMFERMSIDVELLVDSELVGIGQVRLADFEFNSRGSVMLWVRVIGNKCPNAEIKLGLDIIGEKDRRKKFLNR